MSRYVVIFVGVLEIILAAAWGISHVAKAKRESIKPTRPSGAIPVEVAVIERGTVEEAVALSGSLQSPAAVMVVSKASGRIVLKNFKKGSAVNVDDILYEVEKDTVDAAKRQAEAGVAAAKASLVQARAAFKNADIEYKRAKTLFQQGSITRQMLDAAETGYSTANGALSAADASLKNAIAALDLAAIAYNDTTIKSPVAGRVTEDFNLVVGATLAPGAPVARVVWTSTLKAVVPFPECYISRVEKGTPIHIYPEGYTGVIDARVTTLNPSVNEMNRSVELSALFSTPADKDGNELVLPGQSCRVELVLDSQDGLVAPASAVVKQGDLDAILVMQDGLAKIVPVKLAEGPSAEEFVVVGLDTKIVEQIEGVVIPASLSELKMIEHLVVIREDVAELMPIGMGALEGTHSYILKGCPDETLPKIMELNLPLSAVVRIKNFETAVVVEMGMARIVPVKTGLSTSREVVILEGLSEKQRVVSSGARLISPPRMKEKDDDDDDEPAERKDVKVLILNSPN